MFLGGYGCNAMREGKKSEWGNSPTHGYAVKTIKTGDSESFQGLPEQEVKGKEN